MTLVFRKDHPGLQRLAAAKRNSEHFWAHLDEFRAQGARHVIMHDGVVVGSGETPEAAWEEARKRGHGDPHCMGFWVPDPGVQYFF